jgi:hypothetical protein
MQSVAPQSSATPCGSRGCRREDARSLRSRAFGGGILIDKLLEMTHKNATTGNAVIASLIGIAFFFIVLESNTGELVCGAIAALVGVIDLILCFKK